MVDFNSKEVVQFNAQQKRRFLSGTQTAVVCNHPELQRGEIVVEHMGTPTGKIYITHVQDIMIDFKRKYVAVNGLPTNAVSILAKRCGFSTASAWFSHIQRYVFLSLGEELETFKGTLVHFEITEIF